MSLWPSRHYSGASEQYYLKKVFYSLIPRTYNAGSGGDFFDAEEGDAVRLALRHSVTMVVKYHVRSSMRSKNVSNATKSKKKKMFHSIIF